MALHFQSLISSSSGNCLLLGSDNTRIMIDCGPPSLGATRQLFARGPGSARQVDAVIISHMHSDHINHYSLRVIEEYGLQVMVNERCIHQLRGKHYNGHSFRSLSLKTFSTGSFRVGDLSVQPFEVPHSPGFANYGFSVSFRDGGRLKTAVIATDFHNGSDALEHFVNADFIFVESNHDPALLAKYFNPMSRYHMSNPGTAGLLCMACKHSRRKPRAVMLGHLSSQRNTDGHAIGEIGKVFRENGTDMCFSLFTAPRYGISIQVEV